MAEHDWSIGLAPLRDTKFARGKSHIKWLENSLLGVPTVASNVYAYAEPIQGTATIDDGETGLLAKDDEWEEKLALLIEDEKLRKYMGRDARKYVVDNWTYTRHAHKWEDAFKSVIENGSQSI